MLKYSIHKNGMDGEPEDIKPPATAADVEVYADME